MSFGLVQRNKGVNMDIFNNIVNTFNDIPIIGYIGIVVITLIMCFVYYSFINVRYYQVIDNKLYVKHGKFGQWELLSDHMEKEHKEEG